MYFKNKLQFINSTISLKENPVYSRCLWNGGIQRILAGNNNTALNRSNGIAEKKTYW